MSVLSDRYELGRRLGVGATGEVFEARDRRLDRRVAVKVLLPTLTEPEARARFVREVQIAAALVHPNVVALFDVGVTSGDDVPEGRPYSVMELVPGRTLAARLADGPMSVDEALHVADGLLAGLGAAHARGLVHRDVKPGNVLLADDGSVKLTDFGIAKAVHDATTHLTAPGQVLGTPAYLAPEQVAGEPSSPPTDVYAVGVVLYEMLAGAPPFRGDSAIATALAHRQAEVPPLAPRREDAPPAVVRVVDRALAKDPGARHADADAMRRALTEASATDPGAEPTLGHATAVLPAPPAGMPAPERRSRARRWAPAALVGAAVGLLVLGGAVLLGDGDDRDGRGRAAAAEPSTTSTSTSTSTTTTTVPTPRTLTELAAVVAGSPGAYGPRAPELLDGILEILRGDDEDGDRARDLFDDLPDWAARGELDAEIAGLAQQLLVPYLEGSGDEEGPGAGGGPRRGPGSDRDGSGPGRDDD